MPLPDAVARKVQRANELMKVDPPAPAPGTPAAGTDLATAQAEVRRLTEAYGTLQGKYNAEVPRMAADIKTLNVTIAGLNEKLSKRVEAGEVTGLSEDERNIAGKELLVVIQKTAREVAGQEFDTRVKPLSERVDAFQRMSEAQYFAVLDDLVPGWEQQNDDPGYIAWLHQVDPASGKLRDDLLQRAHAAHQGYRVAEVFRAYLEKREIGARAPATPAANANIDHGPGSGNTPTAEPENGKRIWTRPEISGFYRDKREGKYRGRPDEASALENDIIAAQREGRIR